MLRRTYLVAAALALTCTGSGCSSAGDDAVADAALAFYRAVDEEEAAEACTLLAPKTRSELEQSAEKPCPEAILEEDIPSADEVLKTKRFGNVSQVSFDGETTFMAEFPDGWLVMAAGCTPVPGAPYDCQVKGG